MASRESQGLQIALILFVMVSVVLAVTTFVFYRAAEEASSKAAAAADSQRAAEDSYNAENFKVQYLMHILGAQTLAETEFSAVQASMLGIPEMKLVDEQFQKDIQTYGASALPPEKQNYSELPMYLIMALRNKNVDNTNLATEVSRLNGEKTSIEQSEQNRTAEAQKGMTAAKSELESERAKFNEDRQRVNTERDTMLTTFQNARKALDEQVADREKKLARGDAEIKRFKATVQQQKDRISELVDQPFEVPDGQITWVNQATRAVWINLGLADGLRRQTTFSVFDEEAMNVAPPRNTDDTEGQARKIDLSKGKIEITRVISQHLAEARIIQDDPSNPILPGDQIFSPAWKPGRRVRFALVGVLDVNNDGRSDRDLVRNIITMGGGVIDAEVYDDGNMEGEVSASTRYLVRGLPPTESRALDAYGNMIGQAEQLGIQEITLALLLDLMGYKAEIRSVGLGSNADPSAYRVQAAEGKASSGSGVVSEKFRERQPPSRKRRGSAF